MEKKIIIFDLFDTLLNVNQTNFRLGLYLLWKNHFTGACAFKDMEVYSTELYRSMKNLQSENREFSFSYDFIPMSCDKFGIERFHINAKEEGEIVAAISKCTVLPETIHLLNSLKNNCIPTYILSNSMFRSEALWEFLAQYSIDSYITRLFTSADFGIRKPSRKLFDICVNEIKKTNFGVEKEDILFVGNSYKCDATGGNNAGLGTIWLNVNMEENVNNLPIRTINNLAEIKLF